MNYIDVALIVIIVVIGFRGFATGFIAEVSSFVGIVVGVYLASIFAAPVGNALKLIYDFNSNTIHFVLGFLTILFVCMFICWMLGFVLSRKSQLTELGFLNKGLGFVFASIKVFFVFSFIVYAVSQIGFIKNTLDPIAQKHSQMYVSMIKVANVFMRFPAVNTVVENLQKAQANPETEGKTLKSGAEQIKQDIQDSTKTIKDSITK